MRTTQPIQRELFLKDRGTPGIKLTRSKHDVWGVVNYYVNMCPATAGPARLPATPMELRCGFLSCKVLASVLHIHTCFSMFHVDVLGLYVSILCEFGYWVCGESWLAIKDL